MGNPSTSSEKTSRLGETSPICRLEGNGSFGVFEPLSGRLSRKGAPAVPLGLPLTAGVCARIGWEEARRVLTRASGASTVSSDSASGISARASVTKG